MPAAPARRPLLVTTDPDLLEDVLRLAAFAGVDVHVAADADSARPAWVAAPCVLIGADAAGRYARSRPPRRPDVVVLTRDGDPAIWRQAVELGASAVRQLPAAEDELLELISAAVDLPASPGAVAAVIGGRGGAGATTMAAALAATAVRNGRPALLVDADPLGAGIDLVLGREAVGGLRWSDLAAARGRLPAGALVGALPVVRNVPVLTCGRTAGTELPGAAMEAVLAAGRRSGHLVVVDVPRAFDEASRMALSTADLVLLVVPAEVRAVVAASCLLRRLHPLCRAVRLVVRGPSASDLTAEQVAAALELPLGASLKPERGLSGRVERGRAPAPRRGGPLATVCSALVDELMPARAPARAPAPAAA